MAESIAGDSASPAHNDVDGKMDKLNGTSGTLMQFVRHQGGRLELVEETAKYLSSFNCPVIVIGIAGVVGSGKSFLVSRFAPSHLSHS